ncbi:hypothetical protein [Desulfoluna spongiiphila]|uniref:hypothetical protein n=1 Tax=Desulfoluna spongiiphila TaxID=419481 RepID=UPI0012563B7B|nr:hypothetical protein [Desulfoluna spongiiphila]VVS94284.1 hypothetical protein DBB_38560 [Desulfoluna spongiiphila]
MNDHASSSPSLWTEMRNWIIGLTAVLLVIPSMVNAGLDIYKSLINFPKTRSEQINSRLFSENFNKAPIVTIPVPIKTRHKTVNMKLSIYEGGDIFAEYGDYSQWFPFPTEQTSALSLIPSAHAEPPVPVDKPREYTQVDTLKGKIIERERVYSDGTTERYTINRNTGKIENKVVIQATPPRSAPPETQVKIMPFPTVDIEALKEAADTTHTNCP